MMMMMTARAFWFHSLEDNKDDRIDRKLNFPSEWQRNKETFPSFMQQREFKTKEMLLEGNSFETFSFGKFFIFLHFNFRYFVNASKYFWD